jgi:hypothetical protein
MDGFKKAIADNKPHPIAKMRYSKAKHIFRN